MRTTLVLTMKATAFVLMAALVANTHSVYAQDARVLGTRPLILAEAGAATAAGSGFPAGDLPRLNNVLARPDATELRRVVLAEFDSWYMGAHRTIIIQYFQNHSDLIAPLQEELKAFLQMTGSEDDVADVARGLYRKLEIANNYARIAKAEAGSAEARAGSAEARRQAQMWGTLNNAMHAPK